MNLTLSNELKNELIQQAKFFTGTEVVYLHKFANKPGYMLVVETTNLEGFKQLLKWFKSSNDEIRNIDIIRTVSERGE